MVSAARERLSRRLENFSRAQLRTAWRDGRQVMGEEQGRKGGSTGTAPPAGTEGASFSHNLRQAGASELSDHCKGRSGHNGQGEEWFREGKCKRETVDSQIPEGRLCARIEQLPDLLMGISCRVSRRDKLLRSQTGSMIVLIRATRKD